MENALYFHCANAGYKLDSLRKNPAVCVNAVRQQRTKAEEFTVAFESAVAFGTAGHVIGTAKASELSPMSGAVSSLSLVVAGLMTALLFPLLTSFF